MKCVIFLSLSQSRSLETSVRASSSSSERRESDAASLRLPRRSPTIEQTNKHDDVTLGKIAGNAETGELISADLRRRHEDSSWNGLSHVSRLCFVLTRSETRDEGNDNEARGDNT